jgi:predicted small metal-binding protein
MTFMFSIACRDAGQDCDYVAEGNTTDELYNNILQHLKEIHGFEYTPSLSLNVDYEKIISEKEGPWKEAFDEAQKNDFKDIEKIVKEKMK